MIKGKLKPSQRKLISIIRFLNCDGTISINNSLYKKFMQADCEQKARIAKENYISIFYTPGFDCPGFELQYVSQEGLHLYYYDHWLKDES